MEDSVFIVYDAKGYVSTKKTLPKLGSGQYAVQLHLRVPDRFFANPIPTATLEVPESAAGGPVPTVDLTSMEEICFVQEGVLGKNEEGDSAFFCPECGFEHWNKNFGTHYKPEKEE